ncbi:Di-copper centre-containing protein [Xylariaceae sp. FL0804]|nr:Di-copper centre-containing protein [Xylariaceae sp. FL0804]
MRFSAASSAVCAAFVASVLAVPKKPIAAPASISKRAQLVDLSQFSHFDLSNPSEVADLADKALADLFENGAYNDGPKFELFGDGSSDSSDSSDDNDKKVEGEKEVVAEPEVKATSTSTSTSTCNASDPNIRYEWDNFQDTDRTAFVTAIKCLMDSPSGGSAFPGSTSRYEDLVSVHQQLTNQIHMMAKFLPWHRYFVHVFESLLRSECGFDRAMPWWDETKNAGDFNGASIFTDPYFGPAPLITSDGQGTCVESGTFGNLTLHIGPGDGFTDHCLSRAVNESLTAEVNSGFVSDCNSDTDYDTMRGCQELGPHAYGHDGIGAVMSDVTSSVGDPIFFMHHLFVDHGFRIWQNADASRLTTIDGCATQSTPCNDTITLDTTLSSNGILPDATVSDVMNTLGGYLCYRYDY